MSALLSQSGVKTETCVTTSYHQEDTHLTPEEAELDSTYQEDQVLPTTIDPIPLQLEAGADRFFIPSSKGYSAASLVVDQEGARYGPFQPALRRLEVLRRPAMPPPPPADSVKSTSGFERPHPRPESAASGSSSQRIGLYPQRHQLFEPQGSMPVTRGDMFDVWPPTGTANPGLSMPVSGNGYSGSTL